MNYKSGYRIDGNIFGYVFTQEFYFIQLYFLNSNNFRQIYVYVHNRKKKQILHHLKVRD